MTKNPPIIVIPWRIKGKSEPEIDTKEGGEMQEICTDLGQEMAEIAAIENFTEQ